MQGIVKYVKKNTGTPVKYKISKDIEKDREEFEKRKNVEDNPRSRYIKGIDFEIVEITENPNEKFADYVLTKSKRIHYDHSVREAVADGVKLKKIVNAINWMVEQFPDIDYSFEFYLDRTEEKIRITALVLKNGTRFEQYEFHGGKTPVARTFF